MLDEMEQDVHYVQFGSIYACGRVGMAIADSGPSRRRPSRQSLLLGNVRGEMSEIPSEKSSVDSFLSFFPSHSLTTPIRRLVSGPRSEDCVHGSFAGTA